MHKGQTGLRLALAALSLGAFGFACAAPLTYQFTTTGIQTETRNSVMAAPSLRLFADTDIISGQFMYDANAPQVDGVPGVYPAFGALDGTVGPASFSDPGGVALVQDDAPFPVGCGEAPAPVCQGIQDRVVLSADNVITMNLVGFTREDGSMTLFRLINVASFWVGDASTIGDASLPGSLPPAGFGAGGIRLDFQQVDDPGVTHQVFGAGFNVLAVPIPAVAFMFPAGLLAGIAWMRRH